VTEGDRRPSRLALAVHVLVLVGGLLALLSFDRGQWFYGDEWAFLGHRGLAGAERSVWAPHNEHWSTGPILIYRALYALYGVRTYVPYIVVLLLLHIVAAHLLWRLLLHIGVRPPIATALATVFVLLGAGYENLMWAFQIGFVGSVALGLGGLLLVNHEGPWGRRDVAGWLVSVIGLMFSGISVTMVVVAGLAVLLRRGWRQALLTVSVPSAVYLVWLVLIGHHDVANGERSLHDVVTYPEFIWTGLRSAVDQTVGLPGAGLVIVVGLTLLLLHRRRQSAGPAAPAFACALGALVLFAMIAIGRTGLGVEQAEVSRYVYLVMALSLPAVGLALSELAGHSLARGGAVSLALLLVAGHNVGTLRERSQVERQREQRFRARLVAATQLVSSPAVILGTKPEPGVAPDLKVEDLRRMQRDGKLPAPETITAEDRMTVATMLQYAVDRRALSTPFVAPLVRGVLGADVMRYGSCVRLFPTELTPELHLVGGQAMSLRVTTLISGELTGYFRDFTPTVFAGPPRVDKVRAGVPVYVNVTADVDQVVLRVPGVGTTDVCGLR
jgi:hypothetical protein